MCGLYDLKPSVFAERRPENNLVRFAKDFGDGETNIYSGFDVNMESRFAERRVRAIRRHRRPPDVRRLLRASCRTTRTQRALFPDGTSYCHREYGYRPDIKALGSYPLPGGVMFSATYQFTRGVQTGGAGPSLLGNLER